MEQRPLRTAQKDFKPLEENGRMDPATQSAVQQIEEEKNKGQQHSSIKDLQGIKEALAPHWQEPKDTEISLAHSGVKSPEKIQLS